MQCRSILSIILISMAGTGALADSYDAYAMGFAKSENVTTAISDALIVVDSRTNYERFETNDAANPLATATGPCFGSVMIKAGQVSGGGHCNFTDKDDDMVIISWTPQGRSADGLLIGIWSIEGGTGKWDGSTGGGSFHAGDRPDGSYQNDIRGAITLR